MSRPPLQESDYAWRARPRVPVRIRREAGLWVLCMWTPDGVGQAYSDSFRWVLAAAMRWWKETRNHDISEPHTMEDCPHGDR